MMLPFRSSNSMEGRRQQFDFRSSPNGEKLERVWAGNGFHLRPWRSLPGQPADGRHRGRAQKAGLEPVSQRHGALPLWVLHDRLHRVPTGFPGCNGDDGACAQYGRLPFTFFGSAPSRRWLPWPSGFCRLCRRAPTVLDFIAELLWERDRSMVALCMAAMMLLFAGSAFVRYRR